MLEGLAGAYVLATGCRRLERMVGLSLTRLDWVGLGLTRPLSHRAERRPRSTDETQIFGHRDTEDVEGKMTNWGDLHCGTLWRQAVATPIGMVGLGWTERFIKK